ncbi:MAG: helix-turn-helix transcriptional regulator [Cupriavidus necator]
MEWEARHDEVVAQLYEAALSADQWHAALTSVMQQVGADTFHFLAWDRRDTTTAFNLYSHEWMASKVEEYAAYYGAIDPRRQLLEAMPVGSVMACHLHLSDSTVARNEFYQDFLIPGGLRYVTMARLLNDSRRDTIIGLMREVGNKPFTESELAEAQRLISHLCRACRLWTDTQALRTAAAVGQQVAQASAFALIGLDALGGVAYANGHAESLLRDGDYVVGRNGCVGAVLSDDDARLRHAIRQVRATGRGTSLALSGLRSGPQSLLLSITPLQSGGAAGWDFAGACVLITARARKQSLGLSAQTLSRTFGLTAAESAVALALCEGKTPDEHAQALGLSLATVRTQLRAVFEKTQTRRQSETVGLLLGMPAGVG